MGLGILLGVLAALFQDVGYVFSRLFMKREANALELLVFTQLLMGGVSVLLLPWIWVDGFWRDWHFTVPLLGVALGSLGGQLFFFRAEKRVDPSRLASLMGLRVMLVAVVLLVAGQERYDAWQIAGIGLAVLSAMAMNYMHGKLNWNGMGWLGMALAFYCISDLSVPHLIHRLRFAEAGGVAAMREAGVGAVFHASLLGMCLVNIFLAVLMLPWVRRYPVREVKAVVPFVAAWLVKQFFLYGCFAVTGAVFGNVILSARGPLSVLLMLALVPFHIAGLSDHEISWRGWLRRGVATLMMAAAIVFYSLGGSW